jgi:25S rRNA (uracil2634-N3)-methyltransferase
MHRDSLQRSLDANQAYYARIFTPIQPSREQIRFEQKQIISGLYREALEMESRLRAIEVNYGVQHSYRPSWNTAWIKSRFDFIGAIAHGKTLLVGEGNLSFARSIAGKTRIIPSRLTATTFEKERNLPAGAKENAQALQSLGTTVIYGVDATDLAAAFGSMRFDSIVFQFPHVGSREPVEGHNPNFILVRDFLISAASQLTAGGQVLISAVDSPHYQGAFQFDDAADTAGFLPPKAYAFDPSAFPGYEHTMTHQDGNALDNHDDFSTWVFKLK